MGASCIGRMLGPESWFTGGNGGRPTQVPAGATPRTGPFVRNPSMLLLTLPLLSGAPFTGAGEVAARTWALGGVSYCVSEIVDYHCSEINTVTNRK